MITNITRTDLLSCSSSPMPRDTLGRGIKADKISLDRWWRPLEQCSPITPPSRPNTAPFSNRLLVAPQRLARLGKRIIKPPEIGNYFSFIPPPVARIAKCTFLGSSPKIRQPCYLGPSKAALGFLLWCPLRPLWNWWNSGRETHPSWLLFEHSISVSSSQLLILGLLLLRVIDKMLFL